MPARTVLIVFILSYLVLSSSIGLGSAGSRVDSTYHIFRRGLRVYSGASRGRFSVIVVLSVSSEEMFVTAVTFLKLKRVNDPVTGGLLRGKRSLRMFSIGTRTISTLIARKTATTRAPTRTTTNTRFVVAVLPGNSVIQRILLKRGNIYRTISSSTLLVSVSAVRPLRASTLVQRLRRGNVDVVSTPINEASIGTVSNALLVLTNNASRRVTHTHPVLVYVNGRLIRTNNPKVKVHIGLVGGCVDVTLGTLSSRTTILYRSLKLGLSITVGIVDNATTKGKRFAAA